MEDGKIWDAVSVKSVQRVYKYSVLHLGGIKLLNLLVKKSNKTVPKMINNAESIETTLALADWRYPILFQIKSLCEYQILILTF